MSKPSQFGGDMKANNRIQFKVLQNLLILFCVCFFCSNAMAGEGWRRRAPSHYTTKVEKGDEVWLVSSRGVGSPKTDLNKLDVQRFDGEKWNRSSFKAFVDPAPEQLENGTFRQTVIFVHGNRTDYLWAQIRGWQTYRSLVEKRKDDNPVRFVIWSWPADQIRGLLRDLKTKAVVADQHSIYLARSLFEFDREMPVTFVAYSYGARLTLGALHIAGGGTLEGQNLAEKCSSCELAPYRVTLIAPAIRNDCFAANLDKAYSMIDSGLVIKNSGDPVLKFFRLLRREGQRNALGFTGPVGLNLFADKGKRVLQVEAIQHVGEQHMLHHYTQSDAISEMIASRLVIKPSKVEPIGLKLASDKK